MSATEALEHGFRTVFGDKKGEGMRRGSSRRRRRSPLGFKYYTSSSAAETVQSRPAATDNLGQREEEADGGLEMQQNRRVEDNNNNNNVDNDADADADAVAGDDYYHADDDGAANDAAAGNDDYNYNANYDDDDVNEACSQYLVSFLEGTTDARDTCEGIMNAYTAAGEFSSCRIYLFPLSDFFLRELLSNVVPNRFLSVLGLASTYLPRFYARLPNQ